MVAFEVPGRLRRRVTSHLILAGSVILTPVLGPIASVVAYVRDRRRGEGKLRETRIVALVSSMVMIDLWGRIGGILVWLQGPFGRNLNTDRIQAKYQTLMAWYTAKIMWAIGKWAPLPIDISALDQNLLTGNAIVIARHRSIFDAALPAALFGPRGVLPLYTMKDELQWDPNLDIVGERMGHVFVNRTSKNPERELDHIRSLASRVNDDSVAVIFPEGTFFSEKRLKRAIASIARRDPKRAELASKLRHLLPPRPAGTLAMLEAAPDADIVLIGHAGVEPFGSVPEVLANLGDLRHRLFVKAWRFPRSSVPLSEDARIQWLFERWIEMDEWIESHHPLPVYQN